jgi:hypothetical protein
LCESLYSQKELKRVAPSQHVEKILAQIKGWADGLGWEYKFDGRVPVIEGTRRPSM